MEPADAREWLPGRGLRRYLSLQTWLRLVLLPRRQPEADLPEVEDLDAFTTILEKNVQTWSEIARQKGLELGLSQGREEGRREGHQEGRREGRQEGRRTGRREGEAALLLRLIERKFGTPGPAVRRRIERADAEQLLVWGERLLEVDGLAELFGDGSG